MIQQRKKKEKGSNLLIWFIICCVFLIIMSIIIMPYVFQTNNKNLHQNVDYYCEDIMKTNWSDGVICVYIGEISYDPEISSCGDLDSNNIYRINLSDCFEENE